MTEKQVKIVTEVEKTIYALSAAKETANYTAKLCREEGLEDNAKRYEIIRDILDDLIKSISQEKT